MASRPLSNTPALFTSTSTVPKVSTVLATTAAHLLRLGDITGDGQHPSPRLADLLGNRLQRLDTPGGNDHLGSLRGKQLGRTGADAGVTSRPK